MNEHLKHLSGNDQESIRVDRQNLPLVFRTSSFTLKSVTSSESMSLSLYISFSISLQISVSQETSSTAKRSEHTQICRQKPNKTKNSADDAIEN